MSAYHVNATPTFDNPARIHGGLSAFLDSENRTELAQHGGRLPEAQLLYPQGQGFGVNLRVAKTPAHAAQRSNSLDSSQVDAIS